MKRRHLLWAALAFFLLAAIFLFPASRWRIIGWIKGESFYRGRPTSYWREEILFYHHVPLDKSFLETIFGGIFGPPQREPLEEPFWGNEPFWITQGGPWGEHYQDPASLWVVLELLEDQNVLVAGTAWKNLRSMQMSRPRREATIPIVTKFLGHPNLSVRRNAVYILARLLNGDLHLIPDAYFTASMPSCPHRSGIDPEIGSDTSEVVAALMRALEDDDLTVSSYAAAALGEIDPPAKEAVPALLRMLRSNCAARQPYHREGYVPTVGDFVGEALKKIDSEAAANAGIR
jgi:hypothetical protein